MITFPFSIDNFYLCRIKINYFTSTQLEEFLDKQEIVGNCDAYIQVYSDIIAQLEMEICSFSDVRVLKTF